MFDDSCHPLMWSASNCPLLGLGLISHCHWLLFIKKSELIVSCVSDSIAASDRTSADQRSLFLVKKGREAKRRRQEGTRGKSEKEALGLFDFSGYTYMLVVLSIIVAGFCRRQIVECI